MSKTNKIKIKKKHINDGRAKMYFTIFQFLPHKLKQQKKEKKNLLPQKPFYPFQHYHSGIWMHAALTNFQLPKQK